MGSHEFIGVGLSGMIMIRVGDHFNMDTYVCWTVSDVFICVILCYFILAYYLVQLWNLSRLLYQAMVISDHAVWKSTVKQ